MDTGTRVEEYLKQGLTVLEIARLLNISPQAVYGHIERRGLPLPSEKKAG